MQEHKYLVGYVDEESQWIDKFQYKLNEYFEIKIFQLEDGTILSELVSDIHHSNLDCLIVDYELTETKDVTFNGDDVVAEIRKTHPHFPVFIITSKEEGYVLTQVNDNEIVRLKDELTDRPQILFQRIQNKINNYYDSIKQAQAVIDSFIGRKNDGQKLSADEEEQLYHSYLYLEQIYPEEKLLPDSLSAPESVNVLSEFVTESRKILEELKRISK